MRILATITIFSIFACLFVAIRLWTRFRIVKNPGYDDLLIVCALICSLTLYSFIIVERHYGLGQPKHGLSHDVIQAQMLFLWLSIPFYNFSLVLTKLSALVFFTRLFRNRKFLICTYITTAFLVIAGLWMLLSGFFFCVPVYHFWQFPSKNRKAHCLPEGPVWYSNAAMQIFSDVVILVLPMPLLSKLHLPWRQKAGIMLVFGVGIFVIITGSARLYELTTMVRSRDFTKTNAEAAVWSSLEANVSIICACMAPIHPLISRIFSFCFLPQPLHSSPATKNQSTTTYLTSSRKHSVHEGTDPDRNYFYNDFFYSGPGAYTARISRTNTKEDDARRDGENEEGIRVVKELRMVSDTMVPSPMISGSNVHPDWSQDRDIEMQMGLRRDSHPPTTPINADRKWNESFEWDLGELDFPDYKETANGPL